MEVVFGTTGIRSPLSEKLKSTMALSPLLVCLGYPAFGASVFIRHQGYVFSDKIMFFITPII